MPETFFITGATGNIGGRLLPHFLEDPANRLVLLINGKDQKQSEDKGRQSLDFWGVPDTAIRQNITIIRGDITQSNLGLTPEIFCQLSRQITQIIHCAANLKLNMPLADARLSILEGTKNVFLLGQKSLQNGEFKRFHYISTLEISGTYRGTFPEDFLPPSHQGYLNTYERVKAETENFLRNENLNGLPLTIYRPSMVVGDSQTGKIRNFQSFYYLLRDMVLSPKAPFLPVSKTFRVEIAPVDYIARFIGAVSRSGEETSGKVYHLTCGGPGGLMNLPDFISMARREVLRLTGKKTPITAFVSPGIIRNILKTARGFCPGHIKKTIDNQLIFLEFLFLDVVFENRRALEFSGRNGVFVPQLKDCFPALFKFYQERKKTL